MKRNAVMELMKWKEQDCPLPFLLTGTKGTGKTYLAIEFATAYSPQYLYVNFELNAAAAQFFCDKILSGRSAAETIAEYFQLEEEFLSGLVVILDEISFCPPLFKSLTHCSFLPIIAISGLLPAQEMQEHFQICRLFPLRFDEFLDAVGNDWYVDMIQGHFLTLEPVPDIVHQELLALFEEYLVVGGMPAAVNEYISSQSLYNVGEVHCMIKNRMRSVIETTCDEKEAGKAIQVIDVVPEQLRRENKKFRFNSIRRGVTYALYRDGLFNLEQGGMVLRLNEQNHETHFKLYLPDVGMLSSAFAGEETEETRKALLENYVMQTLTVSGAFHLSFWESEAQAKVPFLLTAEGHETPVELRISKGGRGKSIASYRTSHHCREDESYYRFGFENFYSTSVIRQVPYYAVFCIK